MRRHFFLMTKKILLEIWNECKKKCIKIWANNFFCSVFDDIFCIRFRWCHEKKFTKNKFCRKNCIENFLSKILATLFFIFLESAETYSEFEQNWIKTHFFVEIFWRNLDRKKLKICMQHYFSIRFRVLRIFWDQKLNLAVVN